MVGVTGAEARRDAGRAVGAGLTPAAEEEKSTFKINHPIHRTSNDIISDMHTYLVHLQYQPLLS